MRDQASKHRKANSVDSVNRHLTKDLRNSLVEAITQQLQRYQYYIQHGIETGDVPKLSQKWQDKVLERMPKQLRTSELVQKMMAEWRQEYVLQVKRSVVFFVLQESRPVASSAASFQVFNSKSDEWIERASQVKDQISRNLFLYDKRLLEIRNISYECLDSFQMLDLDSFIAKQKEDGAWDVRSFKAGIQTRLEKSFDKFMGDIYPAIMNVFYQHHVEQHMKTERFFTAVRLLLTSFLRELVRKALCEYVQFIQESDVKFKASLELSGRSFIYSPALNEIKGHLVEIVDLIASSFDKVPRVEAELFNSKPPYSTKNKISWPIEKCIHVDFTHTYPDVMELSKRDIEQRLNAVFVAPNALFSEFDTFEALATGQAEADVAEFMAQTRTIQQRIDEIHKYRRYVLNVTCGFPNQRSFDVLTISLEGVINELGHKSRKCLDMIADCVVNDCIDYNRKLSDRFKSIAKCCSQKPVDIQEWFDMAQALQKAKTDELPDLELKLQESKARLHIIVTFSEVKQEIYDLNSTLFHWPKNIHSYFELAQKTLEETNKSNLELLETRKQKLAEDLEKVLPLCQDLKLFSDLNDTLKYLKGVGKIQTQLDLIKERIDQVSADEKLLKLKITEFPVYNSALALLQSLRYVFESINDFQQTKREALTAALKSLDADNLALKLSAVERRLTILKDKDEAILEQPLQEALKQVEQFKGELWLIRLLSTPGLRERHWRQIASVSSADIRYNDDLCYSLLAEFKLDRFRSEIETIVVKASKEYAFEKTLQKMYLEWKDIYLQARNDVTLEPIDNIMSLIERHSEQTRTLLQEPLKVVEEEARRWQGKLDSIKSALKDLLTLQEAWQRLEKTFAIETIRKRMPYEAQKHQGFTVTWREIVQMVTGKEPVLSTFENEALRVRIKELRSEIEQLQNSVK